MSFSFKLIFNVECVRAAQHGLSHGVLHQTAKTPLPAPLALEACHLRTDVYRELAVEVGDAAF